MLKLPQKTKLERNKRNTLNAYIRKKNVLKWIIKAYTLRNKRERKRERESKNNSKEVEGRK